MIDSLIRIVKRISQLCGIFAAALIGAAVVIVCQMVFVRYVLNQNTIWQTDFVTYSLVAATFVASILLVDGRSTWFVGVQLLAVYLVMAIAVFGVPAKP